CGRKKSIFRFNRVPFSPRKRLTALMSLVRGTMPRGVTRVARDEGGIGDQFMRRFLLAFIVFALPAMAFAAPTRLPDQPSKENILAWINTYRMHPAPDRLPTAVRAMSRLGLIADPENSGVYVGFIAGVLAANPERAD